MGKRAKVLLTNFHPGNGGGHRTFVLSLFRSPLTEQFDLAVACPASSSLNTRAREAGHRAYDLDFPGSVKELSAIIANVRKLEQIHRGFPFDIIHCNGSRDHWIALYWKTFYHRSTRIIRSRHGLKKTGNDLIHAWANNRATALNIYVSHGMIPFCEPPGKLHLTNAMVISNGVDTDHFQPRERDRTLAAQLNIRETDFVIGSTSGLAPHKRADLMLRAVAQLPSKENLKVLLFGEDNAGKASLILARELGLETNVIYGGMQTDLRPYLSLIDLGFVLSDQIETSSYAAKEMMAMGIPLVCARFSGLPENIDEGQNGFLIAPGDVGALQQRVSELRNLSPEAWANFRAHSRAKVIREFSLRTQLESLAQAYQRVLTQN